MRFRNRQYVLIAIFLSLAAFKYVHRRRAQAPQRLTSSAPAANVAPGTSPIWATYTATANDALTAAPDAQFQTDLAALNAAINNSNSAELADLKGCRTWLLFYRSERVHPTNRPSWAVETHDHVASCVAHRADISR